MVAVRSWVRGRIGHAGQVKGRGRQVVVRVVVVLVLLCVVAVMGRVDPPVEALSSPATWH